MHQVMLISNTYQIICMSPSKIDKAYTIFVCFGSMEKRWAEIACKMVRMFFPTNPDLANIVGNTDLGFDNLYVFLVFFDSILLDVQLLKFWIPISEMLDFPTPRFQHGREGHHLHCHPTPKLGLLLDSSSNIIGSACSKSKLGQLSKIFILLQSFGRSIAFFEVRAF